MTIKIDCLIIGAGVVGLAIGRQLSQKRQVYILEQQATIGSETSSRNSGVIHAGLYYPRHFLKSQLCIAGRELLYRYCQQHDIAHQRCGKLIVASDTNELQDLKKLQSQAHQHGLELDWLDKGQVSAQEPHLNVEAALLSPQTGIIDSHAYMQQLAKDTEINHGNILTHHCIEAIDIDHQGFTVSVRVGADSFQLHCKTLINAAGLDAHSLSQKINLSKTQINAQKNLKTPAVFYCKGHYFRFQGSQRFKHLVYPLPDKQQAGLGIHLTLDTEGGIKFGPNVDYLQESHKNYAVDETLKPTFLQSIQRYFPAITAQQLHADYAGIRPKLAGPGCITQDFHISTENQHGIAGLIQLFGIESPGLTASLAIANHIDTLLWP